MFTQRNARLPAEPRILIASTRSPRACAVEQRFEMKLHPIDVAIIVVYVATSVLLGYWVSHRASRDTKAYFLGGNTLPWYFLGVSNASGMFDIAGTMWLVYLMFIYGLKSVWIPWLWPVFNQIFLMVYLSTWLRRSNVTTGAEWIRTRFGTGRGAQLSHMIVVIYALVSVIGFLTYGFKGIGKFAVDFLPWHLSANVYALILMGITTFYVVKGGMFSVVITEVLQFCILSVASLAIGIIAIARVSPEALRRVIPAGWEQIFFGWHLNLDWSHLIAAVNTKIAEDGYTIFGAFFMMMLFKGILISMAGPAPNYDMQRILSTKNPREASMMSAMVNVVLNVPRYFMITGLTILALVFYSDKIRAMGQAMDFEMVLPDALSQFVPAGLLGLLVAGLLAAFMSNFAATVNAAPPYIVNDLYRKYINPHASERTYVRLSYLASFGVVVLGIIVRLVCHFHQYRDPVDRLGAVGRLHGFQRSEVVLVAIQRLWLFLGHGDRHRRVADYSVGAAQRLAAEFVPDHRGDLADRLHRGHAADQAGGRRRAQGFLQARAAVGLLGSDPRQSDAGRSVVQAEPGFRCATCSISWSASPGRPA